MYERVQLRVHRNKIQFKAYVMIIGLQQTNSLDETQGPCTDVFQRLMSAEHSLMECSVITEEPEDTGSV
jgi:hypothetical protein